MEKPRKRYLAREYIQRLSAVAGKPEEFEARLKEFISSSLEYRRDVAEGLLAIGADRSAAISKRIFALSNLTSIIRSCSLVEDESYQDQLSEIVDRPVSERIWGPRRLGEAVRATDTHTQLLQEAAFIALIAVNRTVALEKLERFIQWHPDSEFGRRLRRIYDTFFRGNDTETHPS